MPNTLGSSHDTPVDTFEQWRREAPIRRARSEAVIARLGPYERDRPRDPVEAAFLREIGTPERLIGPTR
jgi:hypothetical protein